jgi:hypothetical protein
MEIKTSTPRESSMLLAEFKPLITDKRLRLLFDHWLAARAGKRLPAWSDIDPTAIAPVLPVIWSWRLDEEGQLRGRLAGEDIISVFGTGIRGKLLSEFFQLGFPARADARYRRIMSEPSCCHMQGAIFRVNGRSGHGERIVLPLGADGEHGDGVLGATAYHPSARHPEFTPQEVDGATFIHVR